ncbi:hypothetical protein G4Y73_12280 [Wenzhouxiangella sp. XN201]|nr:hypothetical protein [Wenzhouxiangella sp. XN201]
MATCNDALDIRFEDEIGSVEEGKRSDLVVVDGSPSENIYPVADTYPYGAIATARSGVAFASYMARSAAWISVSASVPSSGNLLIPMLAPIVNSRSLIR